MQTALHIYQVVTAARRELVGAEFVGSEFHRKERLACMFFKRPGKGSKRLALALRFHPTANGLLFLPAGKIEITSGEKPFPFFQERYGAIVQSVEQVGFDRIAKVGFALADTTNGSIIIEALGPSGNLWLLNSANEKTQVLRQREFSLTDVYAPPAGGGEKLDPANLTVEALLTLCEENPERLLMELLSKNIAGYVALLAKEALSRANLAESLDAYNTNSDSAQALVESINELTTLAESSQAGYLYNSSELQGAFPFKLKSVDETPEKFPSYSLAELALMRSSKAQGAEENLTRRYQKALSSAVKRQRRSIEKMKLDLVEYENFERHKEMADILKSNMSNLKRGMRTVTLTDLYREGEVDIQLDEKLSPAGNADAYYKRYQKGRQGLALLQRRLENAELELSRLREISEAFESDADNAQLRYADELAFLLRHKESQRSSPTAKAPRVPYRTYTLSAGLTVYVGRDGTDNDDTTFKHIKPYELWFHASQCPGSHVGLKFPARTFVPSKTEIEETAAIAAWFSKARKNKIAPVNYTERKYVRKPRKAKAGLVTIERERTVMVEPKEPTAQGN
jgi:predicted ribosome quality control (RQC) complex YloA/Tae2 family protein